MSTIIAPQFGILRETASSHYERARDHAIRRLRERYGVTITVSEYERLSNDVRAKRRRDTRGLNPDAVAPCGTPLWRVVVHGIAVWAAWNARTGAVGTFFILRGGR